MTAALQILSPGLQTTVQDFGRTGFQRLGIPVGGALDAVSLRAANLLVGNPPDMGALEMVGVGPAFVVEADSLRIAIVGACSDSCADSARSHLLRRGDRLRVGRLSGYSVAYLAVEGGFALAPVMGSVSADLRGGFGGWRGRALLTGDWLPLARVAATERPELMLDLPDFAPPRSLRALDGPQSDRFSAGERASFFDATYVVGPAWSRMGLRLEGAPVRARVAAMTSDAVVRGSIQIPGDGLPIVLLAECQTTGGYPKIGSVISADLPALGRLGVGARIRFERVSLTEAEAARREQSAFIERLPSRLRVAPPLPPSDLPARLGEANLVSGVVDARALP
jgi:biotin-dependent carboxylase-like uncharacterized protein